MSCKQEKFIYDYRYDKDIDQVGNPDPVSQIPDHVAYRAHDIVHLLTSCDFLILYTSSRQKERSVFIIFSYL